MYTCNGISHVIPEVLLKLFMVEACHHIVGLPDGDVAAAANVAAYASGRLREHIHRFHTA